MASDYPPPREFLVKQFRRNLLPWRPSALVIKESRGREVYRVTTPQDLFDTCLYLVAQWTKLGRYTPPSNAPSKPEISEEAIASLPHGHTRDRLEGEWYHYRELIEMIDEQVDVYTEALRVVEEEDGLGAWGLLEYQRDEEHQGFDIVSLVACPSTKVVEEFRTPPETIIEVEPRIGPMEVLKFHDGTYRVTVGGVPRHTKCSPDDVIRALGNYLHST